MQKNSTKKFATKDLALAAALVAVGFVAASPWPTGLTFTIPYIARVSPVFLVLAFSARRFGPIVCGCIALIIDLLQFSLGSAISGNPAIFNPIITVSAVLAGVFWGLCFKSGKRVTFWQICAAVLLTQIICSMIITTIGIYLWWPQPLMILITSRLIQTGFLIAIQLIILPLIFLKTDIAKRIKFID